MEEGINISILVGNLARASNSTVLGNNNSEPAYEATTLITPASLMMIDSLNEPRASVVRENSSSPILKSMLAFSTGVPASSDSEPLTTNSSPTKSC